MPHFPLSLAPVDFASSRGLRAVHLAAWPASRALLWAQVAVGSVFVGSVAKCLLVDHRLWPSGAAAGGMAVSGAALFLWARAAPPPG